MRTRYVALAAGMAVVTSLTPGAIAHAAPANPPADNSVKTCANPEYTVEGGTISWGIKHSWRKYIPGIIAHGKQELQGVTQSSGSPKDANYFYNFPVDKSQTKVEVKDGKPVAPKVVGTGSVHYTGHSDALDVILKNPTFEVAGTTATANIGYETYVVPGKSMTQIKPEDKKPEYKINDFGKIGSGTAGGWTLTGDKLTLKATSLKYTPDPATAGKSLAGIDRAFMGNYDSSDPLDNATITLNVKKSCDGTDVSDPAPQDPTPQDPAPKDPAAPADDSTGSSSKAGIAQKVGIALGVVGIAGVIGLAFAKARGLLPGSS